jgi:hypothetical protein
MGHLRVAVRDAMGSALPFRAYLSDGCTFWRPTTAHVYFDRGEEQHVLADGSFSAELPGGTYRLLVERGPEYVSHEATVLVPDEGMTEHDVVLQRWVWMNSCDWYSCDLHVHRPPGDMALAVRAEGLNVGTNILCHNGPPSEPLTGPARVQLDETTVYSTLDAELERLMAGPGALVRRPLGSPVELPVHSVALSQTGLAYVELIRDGQVIGRVQAAPTAREGRLEIQTRVPFTRSGWLAARCFERLDGNVRYAQTSPVYVYMGTDLIADESAACFFEAQVEGLVAQVAAWSEFRDESHRQELLELFAAARDFYRQVRVAAQGRPAGP